MQRENDYFGSGKRRKDGETKRRRKERKEKEREKVSLPLFDPFFSLQCLFGLLISRNAFH